MPDVRDLVPYLGVCLGSALVGIIVVEEYLAMALLQTQISFCLLHLPGLRTTSNHYGAGFRRILAPILQVVR